MGPVGNVSGNTREAVGGIRLSALAVDGWCGMVSWAGVHILQRWTGGCERAQKRR